MGRRQRWPRAAPYRGTSGATERYYLAELDEMHRVIRQASPTYGTQVEALMAWAKRRERGLRLVKESLFVEVVE